jgi:hypothetical protein
MFNDARVYFDAVAKPSPNASEPQPLNCNEQRKKSWRFALEKKS